MEVIQLQKANEIKSYLETFDFIKSCKLSGSLENGNYDKYSDIDLKIDVSGADNGKVLLMLPHLLAKKFPIIYTAFAPRFAPKLYVISFGIKDMDVFHFVDIECTANPHITSLSKNEVKQLTNMNSLRVKLFIGVLKRFLRNEDIVEELEFLSKRTIEDEDIKQCLKEEFNKLENQGDDNVVKVIESYKDKLMNV